MISTRSALPQALAYMMSNGENTEPTYGMITNGDDVLLIKLIAKPDKRYSLSRSFSLYTVPEELKAVLQIMKKIAQSIQQS